MQTLEKEGGLERYLFEYEGKLDIDIHFSLISSGCLGLWRGVVFIVLSVRMWLVLAATQKSTFLTLQYLSYLGFTLCWLYFGLTCWDMLLFSRSRKVVCRYSQDWASLLFEIVWCLQYPITIVFWLILFTPSAHFTRKNIILEIGIHGFPLLSLLIDFALNSYQYPLRHLLVVLIIGIAYMAFNMCYSLLVKPIYGPITWTSIGSYIIALLSLLLAIGVHRLGDCVWRKCKKQKLMSLLNQEMVEGP